MGYEINKKLDFFNGLILNLSEGSCCRWLLSSLQPRSGTANLAGTLVW